MAQTDSSSGSGAHRLRQFLTFFGGSAVGLAIDVVGFQVLVLLGIPPWLANVFSAGTSIIVVYFLVTRYTFGDRTRPTTFLLFVCWYALSIIVFSFLIQWATTSSGFQPIVWKVAAVPLSFTANYVFTRFLFGKDRHEMPEPPL